MLTRSLQIHIVKIQCIHTRTHTHRLAHAQTHTRENGCTSVTCNRLVENIVDSSLCLLNDGRITRIPDVSTHKATAIDLSHVTPDLAVNCTWYTEED